MNTKDAKDNFKGKDAEMLDAKLQKYSLLLFYDFDQN